MIGCEDDWHETRCHSSHFSKVLSVCPLPNMQELWRNYPRVYVISYQGSEVSTSEGITKVFERARNYKKLGFHEPASIMSHYELDMCMRVRGFTFCKVAILEATVSVAKVLKLHLRIFVLHRPRNSIANNALVLVHFDEIGLAEASPNNPLKVLHAHLEPGYPKDRPEP